MRAQVTPVVGQSFPGRTRQMWFWDPKYDQCCDQELHVTYTYYTFLVVGYGDSVTYGGPTGPGALLAPGTLSESRTHNLLISLRFACALRPARGSGD